MNIKTTKKVNIGFDIEELKAFNKILQILNRLYDDYKADLHNDDCNCITAYELATAIDVIDFLDDNCNTYIEIENCKDNDN